MIVATCATLAALLAQAKGGETIRLTTDCANVTITRTYANPVTVVADGMTVKGLVVRGGGIVWRGGILAATGGAHAFAGLGYAASLQKASNVTFDNVTFTAAKKALVINEASLVVINNSRFTGLGEDGIIMYRGDRVNVTGNRFDGTLGKPTQCAIAGKITFGLSSRVCVAQGGVWTDGYHADAVQLRASSRVLVAGNSVSGAMQGIGQMDNDSDAPLRAITVERNTVAVTMPHAITLEAGCLDCTIRWNDVRRGTGSTWKAVVRPGAAFACGNRTQDVSPGTAPCPA